MSLRARMGAQNHEEYLAALVAAIGQVEKAMQAEDHALARAAIREAHAQLGIADTRANAGSR